MDLAYISVKANDSPFEWDPNRLGVAFSTIPVQRIDTAVARLLPTLDHLGAYVAGGYARWACSPRPATPLPNDVDVLCPSERIFQGTRAALETHKWEKKKETDYSLTFQPSPHLGFTGPACKLQLLKKFFTPSEKIQESLAKFDLSICRVALLNHDAAIADIRFLHDEVASTLRVCHLKQGVGETMNVLLRLQRYAQRGYEVPAREYVAVISNLRKMEDPAWNNEVAHATGAS